MPKRRAGLRSRGGATAFRTVAPAARRKGRRTRKRHASLSPGRLARAFWQAIVSLPLPFRVLTGAALLLVVGAAINWGYQVLRKPTELLFPVSGVLVKTPTETWRTYGSLFTAHATAIITPELLAALAQVESSGNPVARTYWRWRPSAHPLEWYRPASSAVGMYQITDGTFEEARRYCIHDHVVVADGPWNDIHSCWFNDLYTRVLPTHAIELTAAQLDRAVARALAARSHPSVTREQQQDLAAVIHLCGAGAGDMYVRHGFRLTAGQQCGDHDVRAYLFQVNALKRYFTRLASAN